MRTIRLTSEYCDCAEHLNEREVRERQVQYVEIKPLTLRKGLSVDDLWVGRVLYSGAILFVAVVCVVFVVLMFLF